MAQLKDLIVTGASQLIGDAYTSQIQISKLNALTDASATAYGPGTSGQVLMSNGTNTYWGTPAAAITESTVSGWGFTKNTGTITGATANGGLTVTGSTLGHSNIAITAKTTAGVYPVKIDELGHITEAGTAIVSSTAASGGTTLSLVTTGEKYTWNNKSTVSISQSLTSGTKIGTITINGTATDLYCQTNTNTDTKVTQAAATTATGAYPVLLAYSTATSAITNSVNKTDTLTYNPYTQTLTAPNLTNINHIYTINGAGIYNGNGNGNSGLIICDSTQNGNRTKLYFDGQEYYSRVDLNESFATIEIAASEGSDPGAYVCAYTDKAKIGLQDNSGSSIEVGSTLKINDGTGVGTAGQTLLSDGTKAYWGTISGGSSGDYVLKSGDTMTGSLITQQYVVAGNDNFDDQAHIQAKSNAGRIGLFSGDSGTGTTGFMQVFAKSATAATGKTVISIANDANNTTTLYGDSVDISDGAIKLTNTLNDVWIGLSCGGGSSSGNVGIYRHGYYNGTAAVLSGSGSSGMMIRTRTDGAVESQFKFYGAVFNDYAEYRETKEDIEPGRCITENGDGSLKLTTERLMRGCEIVSDTFGFAIGETKRCKTPTAASGRVLAYCLEGQEQAKNYIGWPVCSGPNGTVSIMTEEEEIKYPSRIIGTISEVPTYDIWHCGKEEEEEIQVNGRIWIRIR